MNRFKRTLKKNALGKALSSFIASIFLVTLILSPFKASALTLPPEDKSSKLAVTEVGFDDMGKVLEDMGFEATEIKTSDLSSKTKISKYDAIYVNCSSSISSVTDKTATVVKEYVEAGGTLYASDWADTLIDKAFPGKVNFYGNKDNKNDILGSASQSHVGIQGEVEAKVSNAGLAAVLGKSKVNVNFNLPSWAVIDSVGDGTKVLMKGPVKIMDYSAASNTDQWKDIDYSNPKALEEASKKVSEGKDLGEKPFTVTFTQGKGRVLYTSFHNEAQNTEDMEKVLDWFAIWGKASKLAKEVQELAEKENKEVIQEIIDVIDENDAKEYTFEATGEGDFKVVLNFGGSEISIKITDPDGKEIASENVSDPPFTESIDAKKGEYKVELKGIDIPEKNYPFVLSAIGDEKALVTDKVESEAKKEEEKPQNQLSLFGFNINLNDPIVWGAGAVVVILLLIIIIWVIKRRKKKPAPQNVVDLSGQNPPVEKPPTQTPPVQTPPPTQEPPAVAPAEPEQKPTEPTEPKAETPEAESQTPPSEPPKAKKSSKSKKK